MPYDYLSVLLDPIISAIEVRFGGKMQWRRHVCSSSRGSINNQTTVCPETKQTRCYK